MDGLQSNYCVLGLAMTVIIMDGLQSNCVVLGLNMSYMDGLQSNCGVLLKKLNSENTNFSFKLSQLVTFR